MQKGRQLQLFFKAMEHLKNKLHKAIRRTNYAYDLYRQTNSYLAAKRIYNANKIIYSYLSEYIYLVEDIHFNNVLNYMMHLEDWFMQFESEELKVQSPSDLFVFERIKGGISYPHDFIYNYFLRSKL